MSGRSDFPIHPADGGGSWDVRDGRCPMPSAPGSPHLLVAQVSTRIRSTKCESIKFQQAIISIWISCQRCPRYIGLVGEICPERGIATTRLTRPHVAQVPKHQRPTEFQGRPLATEQRRS